MVKIVHVVLEIFAVNDRTVKTVNIFAVMMSQLEDELESCQEEACLRDHQLEATRELVTVLQKHIDVCQHQLDTQSVVFIIVVLRGSSLCQNSVFEIFWSIPVADVGFSAKRCLLIHSQMDTKK